MSAAPLDATRIFEALAEHEVDYVLIGGMAVQVHGHVRMTNDADLIPAPDRHNLERLALTLRELGAVSSNPGSEGIEVTADSLPRAAMWQFSTPHGGLDIAQEVPGGAPFEDLARRALVVRLDELEIKVVSLDDLIRMKLASGRPVDLADVAALTDPLVGD